MKIAKERGSLSLTMKCLNIAAALTHRGSLFLSTECRGSLVRPKIASELNPTSCLNWVGEKLMIIKFSSMWRQKHKMHRSAGECFIERDKWSLRLYFRQPCSSVTRPICIIFLPYLVFSFADLSVFKPCTHTECCISVVKMPFGYLNIAEMLFNIRRVLPWELLLSKYIQLESIHLFMNHLSVSTKWKPSNQDFITVHGETCEYIKGNPYFRSLWTCFWVVQTMVKCFYC